MFRSLRDNDSTQRFRLFHQSNLIYVFDSLSRAKTLQGLRMIFFFFHFAFKHVCVIFVFLCTSIKRKKSFTILHPQSQPHSLTLSKSRTFKNSCFRYFIHKVCIACVSLGLNITLFSVFRIGYQFVEFKINFARQCLICEPRSPPTTGIVSHRLTAKFTLHVN